MDLQQSPYSAPLPNQLGLWVARHGTRRYAVAVGAALLAFLLGLSLQAAGGSPVTFAYPAALAASAVGGLGPGLLATALSAGLAFLSMLGSTHPLELSSQTNLGSLGTFLMAGVAFALVSEVQQRRFSRESAREREVTLLLQHTTQEQLRMAREQAEQHAERLTRSEQRFRTLIEKSSDLLLVLDANKRFQFWSPSATEALGWTAEEVIGKTPAELRLIHPDDVHLIQEATRSLAAGEKSSLRVATRHRHKDGSWRLIEAVARNLLTDSVVKGVVLNARDVTEQRAAEDEVQQAKKLESIGRLAGGIAHDFNNLLTVILSCTEGLRDALKAKSAVESEDVEHIREAGERARELTRQLLAFARRQVIAPVILDVNQVVRLAERLLRRVVGENIDISVTTEKEPWLVRTDPGQLEQVLMNLAVNARDAMKAGGKLLIAVRNDTLGPRFGATPPPGGPTEWVCLSVRDTGSGMPPEVQARLFEPFFTTKRLGHGTGLGLATVYGIVNQLGGRIAVRSELNKGTELSIWLPRELNAHLPTPKLESSPGLPVGNESVLVVEDEPLVRELTVRALRAAGHQVEEAGNGREALAVLAARAVPFDLIVTDVMMPELGGKELALEVRRARPEQRVLFVSGYPRDAVGSKGQLLEGTDFLGKPFTPRSLLRKVRAMLDAGRVGPRG